MSSHSATPLMIHPPAIVHVSPIHSPMLNPNDEAANDDYSDECSDLSSAGRDTAGSYGNIGSEDDDDDDDDQNNTNLNERIAAVMMEHQKHTVQLQRQNSELGRQSRKSRLRRTSFQHHTTKLDHSPNDDMILMIDLHNDATNSNPIGNGSSVIQDTNYTYPIKTASVHQLEEKKCDASNESPISDADCDDMLLIPKRKIEYAINNCTNNNKGVLQQPPREFTMLNESNCSPIAVLLDDEYLDDEEGDELPLLPRKNQPMIVAQRESSSATNTTTTSSSAKYDKDSLSCINMDHSFSPMDEIDELDYHNISQKPQETLNLMPNHHFDGGTCTHSLSIDGSYNESMPPLLNSRRPLVDSGISPVQVRSRSRVFTAEHPSAQEEAPFDKFENQHHDMMPQSLPLKSNPPSSALYSYDMLPPTYRTEDCTEPPPYDEVVPANLLIDQNALRHQSNHRQPMLWKESESFDDDIDLYMAPTDEALDVSSNYNNNNISIASQSANDDIERAMDAQQKRNDHDDQNNQNVPLDETLLDQTLLVENDLPPIAPVPNFGPPFGRSMNSSFDQPFAVFAGSDATNAIVVEDVTAEENFDLAGDTNVLNISMDSNDSSTGPIGPLIRLEQHQPLLHSVDDISSSDETPLAGNGPLASRVHRNRTYREPKMHGYWKEQQQQQQQKRSKPSRRKRSLRHRKVTNHSNEVSVTSATYLPNENSIDHILPPLIIDPEQLRSIGITAIMAVCNGIGSLFLTNQESSCSESPRDKPADRYKLLANDEPMTKKRSKGRRVKLVPEEMSPSDQTDNTSNSDVTPVYFEDALQRSIEADIRAGDTRLASANIPIHPSYDVFDHQFANFDTVNKETTINDPYSFKRTLSAPIHANTHRSRENMDRLWLDKIKAVKCSSHQLFEEHDATKETRNPLDAIAESPPAVNDRKSSREKKNWLRAVTTIDRLTATPDDESLPLENKIGKRSFGKRRMIPAAAKRIAALRGSNDKAASISKIDDKEVLPEMPMYSPAISSMDGRDGALSPVSPINERQTRSDESAIIHTPLAEPPALRRLNKSLDFDESFGPDFAIQALELEEPPSLSRATTNNEKNIPALGVSMLEKTETVSHFPEGDIPAITLKSSCSKNDIEPSVSVNTESKPSADRSPMSDFLLLRLQASSSDMSSLKVVERSCSPNDDSDCSSTGELLSSLDGLVKDLDGLATSRRIERQLTSDSQVSDTILLPESYVPTGAGIVEDFAELKVLDLTLVGMPELVDSLNNEIGIPRGDIMISLLKSDKVEPTWISRVDESIWRGRSMRSQFDTLSRQMRQHESSYSIPLRRRTSFCVDVDDGRVVVGIDKILETQKAADEMLKHDEFDDALALHEAIYWSYEHHMDNMDPSDERMKQMKSYLATSQYNLGIIHMLRGEHDDAIEYFEQSTLLYSKILGVMHIASLVKTAICHFAMEDYTTAYSELELALSLSRDAIHTLSDYRQIAEVLNNLGSLSYMGGEIERSMLYFRESIKILTKAVDVATYSESKYDSHSTILALSIAKSNVAFLSLTFYRDVSESVTMFESVIKEQQLLLRDADVTLMATMEHLAAANLLAGDKSKALQVLRRVLRIQIDAYGGGDTEDQSSVCERTRHKIYVLEQSDNEQTLICSGNVEAKAKDSSCSVTTTTGNTILPILETSRESSGSNSRNSSSSNNNKNNNNNNSNDEDESSPNTSMTNTLKAWRESHAMTDESFLTNRVII